MLKPAEISLLKQGLAAVLGTFVFASFACILRILSNPFTFTFTQRIRNRVTLPQPLRRHQRVGTPS
jgi:hypothetical protein